ncbi:MAG: hypothetical protein JWN25_3484 [Verrucomicrobiales bacterium]|nr:hypothetical protein [Verrucomicrobiales bacterium]
MLDAELRGHFCLHFYLEKNVRDENSIPPKTFPKLRVFAYVEVQFFTDR